MKDRDLSLDIIRILACFVVALMYSPIPSANGQFLAMLSYIAPPCTGMDQFFIV